MGGSITKTFTHASGVVQLALLLATLACGARSGVEPGEAFGGRASVQGAAGSAGGVRPPAMLERLENVPPDKIDLLFVIDNSASMADKQHLFTLSPDCLGAHLSVQDDGHVACRVLEVAPEGAGCPECLGSGRSVITPELRARVLAGLRAARHCGGAGQPRCESLCTCEIDQLTGDALQRCRTQEALPVPLSGFCYVEASAGGEARSLLEHCPADRKRRIRFAGENVPQSGMSPFLVCD